MADDKKKEDVDPRLEYMSTCVLKTFRMKQDRWQKLMTSDDKVTADPFPLVTMNNECNPCFPTDNSLRLAEQPEGEGALFRTWGVGRSDCIQSVPRSHEIQGMLLYPTRAYCADGGKYSRRKKKISAITEAGVLNFFPPTVADIR